MSYCLDSQGCRWPISWPLEYLDILSNPTLVLIILEKLWKNVSTFFLQRFIVELLSCWPTSCSIIPASHMLLSTTIFLVLCQECIPLSWLSSGDILYLYIYMPSLVIDFGPAYLHMLLFIYHCPSHRAIYSTNICC